MTYLADCSDLALATGGFAFHQPCGPVMTRKRSNPFVTNAA